MSSWYCEVCDLTLKVSSRYGHCKSKKHLDRLNSTPVKVEETSKNEEQKETPSPECTICLEPLNNPSSCRKCCQSWCSNCDQNIYECPYCRVEIVGRESQSQEQKRQIQNWYASSSAFDPTPLRSRNRIPRHLIDASVLELMFILGIGPFQVNE